MELRGDSGSEGARRAATLHAMSSGSSHPSPAVTRIGLIAGCGAFPLAVARAARRSGLAVVCAGIRQEVDPRLRSEVDVFRSIGLLSLAKYLRFFRRHGVRQITWAGGIRKERLLSWRGLLYHMPDLAALRCWMRRMRRRDRQSQTLLQAIAAEFEQAGFQLAQSTDLCPELLVEAGVLTRRQPTQRQLADIAFAWRIAKRMADLDVGQSVAVCDRATIAVEGMEGTDRNIRRAGELCKRPFTVVKIAMDGHDMRFDVPTVGPATIETMHEAHAGVLALEAGKTIVLDRERVVELADRHGIVVAAYREPPVAG